MCLAPCGPRGVRITIVQQSEADQSRGGKVVLCKQLRRGQLAEFFGNLPPRRIGREACASSHHWGRTLEPGRLTQGAVRLPGRTLWPVLLTKHI
jgi:hypothetical protein